MLGNFLIVDDSEPFLCLYFLTWCLQMRVKSKENMVGQKSELPPRMLQAGPSSGSSPTEIKKRLKTGLDCLQKGLSILEVLLTVYYWSLMLKVFCSYNLKAASSRRLWKNQRSHWLNWLHLLTPYLWDFEKLPLNTLIRRVNEHDAAVDIVWFAFRKYIICIVESMIQRS